MKNYLILFAVAFIMAFSSCQPKEKQTNAQKDIVGIYQYIDGREGFSVITDKYFIFTGRWKHEPSPVDSEDYYEREYKSIFLEAGTWTMQDSIVSCYQLFGKNGKIPPQDKPSFRWTYSFKKDTFIFHVLNKNGEVVGTGTTLKLKESNIQNDLIGVYQYIEGGPIPEGMSVMTNDYFIFTGGDNDKFSIVDSTETYENKYKSLIVEAGRYTLQDSIVSCYMLFGKNGKIPPQDRPSFRFAVSYKSDTLVADVLNKKGEHRGITNYNIKLE